MQMFAASDICVIKSNAQAVVYSVSQLPASVLQLASSELADPLPNFLSLAGRASSGSYED